MLKRLFRQRRRLVLMIILMAAALAVHGVGDLDMRYAVKHQLGVPEGVVTLTMGGIVLALSLIGSVLVLLLLPGARKVIEVGAASALINNLVFKYILFDVQLAQTEIAYWVGLFGTFIAVDTVLSREPLYRRGLRLPYRARTTRDLSVTPDALWRALAPCAENVGTYWTDTLRKVRARPDLGPDHVEVTFQMGSHLDLTQIHTRKDWDRETGFAYDFRPERGAEDGPPGVSGTYIVTYAALPDGRTRVSITHDYPALGLGSWLLVWLDDLGRGEMDAVQAHLLGQRDWSIEGWAARQMAKGAPTEAAST